MKNPYLFALGVLIFGLAVYYMGYCHGSEAGTSKTLEQFEIMANHQLYTYGLEVKCYGNAWRLELKELQLPETRFWRTIKAEEKK